MKRKRGRKPGKKSAAAAPASPSSPSTEEASSPEDQAADEDDAPLATAATAVPEPPPPPPPPPSQPHPKPPSTPHADITYTKPKVGAVYGRVKLKFKKPVEPPPAPQQQQLSSSAAPADAAKPGNAAVPEAITEAATEKVSVVATGGQQMDIQASETSGGSDKEKVVRKVGIKIKSAGLSSSSPAAVENGTPDRKPYAEDDRKANEPLPSKPEDASGNKEIEDTAELRSSQESEKKQSTAEQRRRHDEKELAAAVEAIKKVMKMDAAEPFNTPVDPVALGIPDYFDIIDTPMDFGTICQNLEHGNKYMNSEDVYKDVQFIWDNCTKYNSKGDYVVELMKRVKKAFMKHWLAAGLYSDVQENGGNDNTGDEDAKGQSKSKSKNKRRRPGNDRHKNDCVCAVCQVTRRKKEKDEMAAIDNEIIMIDSNTLDQHNLEGNSGANNPGSHDTSSSQEQPTQTDMYKEASEANDSDVQMEDRPSSLLHSGGEDEGSRQYPDRKEGIEYRDKGQEEHAPSQPSEYSGAEHHPKVQMESSPEVEMEDYPVQQENPSFMKLCASLFPRNRSSIFRGRHSLFRPQHRVPLKEGPLHVAIAAIMKQ